MHPVLRFVLMTSAQVFLYANDPLAHRLRERMMCNGELWLALAEFMVFVTLLHGLLVLLFCVAVRCAIERVTALVCAGTGEMLFRKFGAMRGHAA